MRFYLALVRSPNRQRSYRNQPHQGTAGTRKMDTMFLRSGLYHAKQHALGMQRPLPPRDSAAKVRSTDSREDLGAYVRLWLVVLAGVAVILLGSWLATS